MFITKFSQENPKKTPYFHRVWLDQFRVITDNVIAMHIEYGEKKMDMEKFNIIPFIKQKWVKSSRKRLF